MLRGWRKWALRIAGVAAAGLALVLLRMWIYPYFGRWQYVLRMSFAAVLSFLIVVLGSPRMIRFLVRRKLGDRPEFDHADLNELTRHKSATPTMGGMLIVVAIFVATYLFTDVGSMYVRMSFLVLIWLGLLGAADDWLKLEAGRPRSGQTAGDKPTRDGLKMWEKILFQIALAVLLAIFTYSHGRASGYPFQDMGQITAPHYLFFPFKSAPVYLPLLAYVIISVVVMVGSCNAVNFTDGMDGLAPGCVTIVTGVFLVVAWAVGTPIWARNVNLPHVPEAAELTILCAAMAGACMGFLWYNCLPAQVFMGDTGSLPLGGLIGYIAVVTRQELMLLIAGGVFVIEAVSVILQILYFKFTGGRRLFRCAPIHHHFHLLGWAENKVVVRFWLLGIVCAALALATLKLR